jgi:hypothetical protein
MTHHASTTGTPQERISVPTAENQITLPRQRVIELQRDPAFTNWVRSAQVIGNELCLFLREFVDRERLPQKITVDAFRERFQIILADAD